MKFKVYPMKLDNAHVKQILETIAAGMPIEPPPEGWTVQWCMEVAAMMTFAAGMQGEAPGHTNVSADVASVIPQHVMIAEQMERSAREALYQGRKGFKKR